MTSVVQQRILVTSTGDIQVNGRSGINMPLTFNDADGNPLDVSARPLYFEVSGRLRKALAAGAAAYQRVLYLTDAEIGLLSMNSAGAAFVFRDESYTDDLGEVIPFVFWSGVITLFGFNKPPPSA